MPAVSVPGWTIASGCWRRGGSSVYRRCVVQSPALGLVRRPRAEGRKVSGRRGEGGGSAAGRMLAVAPQFDFVPSLPAMIATELSVRAVRCHHAFTHSMSAFRFDTSMSTLYPCSGSFGCSFCTRSHRTRGGVYSIQVSGVSGPRRDAAATTDRRDAHSDAGWEHERTRATHRFYDYRRFVTDARIVP